MPPSPKNPHDNRDETFDGMVDGLALAALLCEDHDGTHCSPALAPSLRSAALTHLRKLAGRGPQARRARHQFVRATLSEIACRPEAPATLPGTLPSKAEHAPKVPARALALLAGNVEREVGRRWLAAAPLPRAGYIPEASLLRLLRRTCLRTGQKKGGPRT